MQYFTTVGTDGHLPPFKICGREAGVDCLIAQCDTAAQASQIVEALQLAERVKERQKLYAIFVPQHECREYADTAELAADLGGLIEDQSVPLNTRVFMLRGERLHLSAGNPKYLLDPDTEPVRLGPATAAALTPDVSGALFS